MLCTVRVDANAIFNNIYIYIYILYMPEINLTQFPVPVSTCVGERPAVHGRPRDHVTYSKETMFYLCQTL